MPINKYHLICILEDSRFINNNLWRIAILKNIFYGQTRLMESLFISLYAKGYYNV